MPGHYQKCDHRNMYDCCHFVFQIVNPYSIQIKVNAEEEPKLKDIENLAVRALTKMAGISAKENVKVLEHLSEGRELLKAADILDVDSLDGDDEFDNVFDS